MKAFSLVIWLFPLLISAQEIGVSHFERKIDLTKIFLPGEEFNSSPYKIPFPDSLYTFAQIKLKKVTLTDTKVRIKFSVADDTYVSTKISVKKGAKRSGLLTLLETQLGSSISEDKVQCFKYNDTLIKLVLNIDKRIYHYTFTIEPCEVD